MPSLSKRVDRRSRIHEIIKRFQIQCLAALSFKAFVFRRQVETAPESRFRQGPGWRLFHFCKDRLWRAVDNSTVYRNGHCEQQIAIVLG